MIVMRLNAEPFEKIKSGRKTIELRINDEKRRELQIGDIVVFKKRPDEKEEVHTKVMDLLVYPTFGQLLDSIPMVSLDCEENEREDVKSRIYDFYTRDEEYTYGVVGIIIQLNKTDA